MNCWLYLWCDTDNEGTQRWLIFNVSDTNYSDFIRTKITLRKLINQSEKIYCLDARIKVTNENKKAFRKNKRLREMTHDKISLYLPSHDSFFDPKYLPLNRTYFNLFA